MGIVTELICLITGISGVFGKHTTETSGSKKCWEFLQWMDNCRLLKGLYGLFLLN
jgi:hypothetical protein